MAAVTVGQHVEQHGAGLLFFEDRFLAAVSVDHGQRIEAVHAFGMHLLGVHAGADAGCEIEAHRLSAGLSAHAVLVVHDVDDHRQAAFHVAFPELFELVHGGEGHAFPDRTACHRSIADVGHDDTGFAVYFLIEGRADGDTAAAAYDGVVRVDAERREEGVHAAAQSFVESGRTGKNFGQCAVQQEADTEFLDRAAFVCLFGNVHGGAVPEFVHDLFERLVVEQFDGTQAFGENFAVATVGTEDKVVDVEHVGHPDSSGFLAGREVGGARVVVFDAVVAAGGLHQLQHRFEFADHHHVAVDALQVVFGEVLAFELLLRGFFVLVDGDRREGDLTGFPHLFRIDVL